MVRKKKQIQPMVPQSQGISWKQAIIQELNLKESYTSLLLGMIVVVIVSFVFVSFVRSKNLISIKKMRQDISSQKTEDTEAVKSLNAVTYVIVEGDDLKSISKKFYGTVDYWETIAKENNIQDVDIINVGENLKIPRIQVATQTDKITGTAYTTKDGDHLWDIAVRAYGDGFKWPDIAKTNSIDDPDMIVVGTSLKIPR